MNDKIYFLKKHAIQKSMKDILLYLKMMRDYLTDRLIDRLIDKKLIKTGTDKLIVQQTKRLTDCPIDQQADC